MDNTKFLTAAAERKPFRITVREQGTLDSLNSSVLRSEVEGSTVILSIVPEGTPVEEGDIVCELDVAGLREREKEQQIKVTQAEADLTKSQEDLEIQKRQNESDFAAANLAYELAQLDLRKYKEGEYLQSLREVEGESQIAQEELTRATEVYEFTKRLSRKGYKSQSEVEAARIAVLKAENELETADEKQRVLEDFEYERSVKELDEVAAESIRELDRVKRQARAAIAQFKAEFEANELKLEVEQEQLANFRRQLEASVMRAPQRGEVVYSQERNYRSNSELMGEGTTVRERQIICKIPDLTRMKVDARVHESMITLISKDLPVDIRIDAFPEYVFRGTVTNVSSVPVAASWYRPDLKEYEVEIGLDPSSVPPEVELKARLSVEVEIIVEARDDVLQVPMQSVVAIGPEHIIYRLGPDGPVRQGVEVGAVNDSKIEILQGIEAGERVILNPRTQFADEISELAVAARETASQLLDEERNADVERQKSADVPSEIRTRAGPRQEVKTEGAAAANTDKSSPAGKRSKSEPAEKKS
ncbi:efflux RND transporter periplasmic adaptor subunit [Stratiformator vulcanicus]|uniref:Multidrug resistance protein MdtA n=1 Tax=Stratiformator vulcanicus TaxID=2527980 RepID=A0A517QWV2_9PLAN|nr:HlyD family efflux transporter periplasmic adaptor subunit [Stratiformator vulcanicus]QDT36145.1 Multidrug resistance protein MdtA [Stratiformator vulcanicus]